MDVDLRRGRVARLALACVGAIVGGVAGGAMVVYAPIHDYSNAGSWAFVFFIGAGVVVGFGVVAAVVSSADKRAWFRSYGELPRARVHSLTRSSRPFGARW